MNRAVLAGVTLVLLVAGLGLSPSRSVGSTETLFESSIVGLPAGMNGNTSGTIRGVAAAGAPWVASGEARLDRDGRLRVEVEGLLLDLPGSALNRTTGAVTGVRASLTCHKTDVVATTGVVPLSPAGDAEIDETITLPSKCVGSIVLIRIGRTGTGSAVLGPWIAATGF